MANMVKKAEMDTKTTAAIVGALLGGTSGALSAGLMWKKPDAKKRLIAALAGTGLGAVSGLGLAHAVKDNRSDLQRKLDNAVGGSKDAVMSLFRGLPTKQEWVKLPAWRKTLYGDTEGGVPILGRGVKWLKDALALNKGDEASPILSASAGAGVSILGSNLAHKGVDNLFRGHDMRKALRQMGALPGATTPAGLASAVKGGRRMFMTEAAAADTVKGLGAMLTPQQADTLTTSFGTGYKSHGKVSGLLKFLATAGLFMGGAGATTGAQHLFGASQGTQEATMKALQEAAAKAAPIQAAGR